MRALSSNDNDSEEGAILGVNDPETLKHNITKETWHLQSISQSIPTRQQNSIRIMKTSWKYLTFAGIFRTASWMQNAGKLPCWGCELMQQFYALYAYETSLPLISTIEVFALFWSKVVTEVKFS